MGYHRPYIRSDVRAEIERRAEKNEKGQFLDANTGKPIEGQYDLGHKPGHEHWRESERATAEGLSQQEFNDRMNNPDFYQIEDPHENRSHAHEMPKNFETITSDPSSSNLVIRGAVDTDKNNNFYDAKVPSNKDKDTDPLASNLDKQNNGMKM